VIIIDAEKNIIASIETYLSDLGQQILHTPDLSLTSQAILAAKFKLLVKTLLLKRTSDGSIGLADWL
jgi:hypothetical protein